MVDAINGTGSSGGIDSAAVGRARMAESFDTFLSLLTTQLKNQDPLSPLDSNQFTQQIVQMTGVEQQLLTNDLLKKMVVNTANGVSTAVSLIGKEVRAASADAQLANNKAEWVYNLGSGVADLKLEILDSKGRVVKAMAPEDREPGDHTLTWDGKDQNGLKLPDGAYRLRVTARDSQGETVASTTYQQGLVTGVEQADGQTLITVNGAKVPWDKVSTIKQPPAPAAAASTDNPDGKTSSPAAA